MMSESETSAGAAHESAPPQPDNAGLQFDRAEFTESKLLKCSTCTEKIQNQFYQINGKTVCETCRGHAEALMTSGSGARRFIRALVFGSIAGAIGSGIYYAIQAATGYQIGLIAILVGFMVGAAVKHGSDGRGGWVYQCLAVFLTYTAIVSSYVPMIISEINQQNSQAALTADADGDFVDSKGESTQPKAKKTNVQPKAKTASAPAPLTPDEPAFSENAEPVGFVGAIIALCLLIALMYAIPFLAGLQNIVGLIIIGFGVYQAWTMNQRMQTEIKGPFRVTPDSQGATPSGA
jgi:hypothetical protein